MGNKNIQHFIQTALRHYVRVMAFAVLVVIGLLLVVYFVPSRQIVEAPVIQTEKQVATTSPKFIRSAPVRLIIPAIKLDTTFVPPLGLNPDKTVSVPDNYTEVGWYSGGVTPGEIGPSVILGHVDSYQGPAVFWPLGKLKIGDEIEVDREDGSVALFEVVDIGRYDQDAFPTQLVYGPIDFAGLRLVTCTGIYDHGTQKYSHNLVVYAKLKE